MKKNHLADATSPYLLQHADNPVDWHEWSEEALSLARDSGRPILLSIGYSACHWCHVMAHESFEDTQTAELMNELYVNIKVDREERPDLDKIYQSAHQLLAQCPGGWPLTVFLTPDDQAPFFAGTYFPDKPRHGLPAFRDLLRSIANAYDEQRREILEQNRALLNALSQLNPSETQAGKELDSTPLELARQQLAASFDETHGGFDIWGQCKNSGGDSHAAVYYTFLTVIDIKEDKWLAYLACPCLTQITDQSVWPFDPDTYTVGIGSSARIP